MFLFLYLITLTKSRIPMKFKDLAKRAKMNALNKIPKNLREDTKYPGYYESDNYRFKLLKTFTSSNTHDIKGFDADINHFAIVKRKHFNLKDGFVFIDPDTQHLYQLNKVVASENDVAIYQSNKTNIFFNYDTIYITIMFRQAN